MKEHESEEARIEAALNYSLGLLEPEERERLKNTCGGLCGLRG